MFPTIADYIQEVADYIANEFTAFRGQESALVEQLSGAKLAKLVQFDYAKKYWPCILGDALATGTPLVKEVAGATKGFV